MDISSIILAGLGSQWGLVGQETMREQLLMIQTPVVTIVGITLEQELMENIDFKDFLEKYASVIDLNEMSFHPVSSIEEAMELVFVSE